jgi:hypothetical protein
LRFWWSSLPGGQGSGNGGEERYDGEGGCGDREGMRGKHATANADLTFDRFATRSAHLHHAVAAAS